MIWENRKISRNELPFSPGSPYARVVNTPRLLLAIAVGFVFLFASDFLVHHFWLGVSYKAAAHLWRPEADMNAHLPWLFAGQLLCAVTFVFVWALGFAGRSVASGIVFGILMGAFQQVWALINFAVFPLPGAIAAKWFRRRDRAGRNFWRNCCRDLPRPA